MSAERFVVMAHALLPRIPGLVSRRLADPIDESGAEVPGDTQAADIVGPTGEEMPVQEHDEIGRRPGRRLAPADPRHPPPHKGPQRSVAKRRGFA